VSVLPFLPHSSLLYIGHTCYKRDSFTLRVTVLSGGGDHSYTLETCLVVTLWELQKNLRHYRNHLFPMHKKNQLDATDWFIALIICSTCFGHFCAHHQKLETICVLLLPMVCSALVAGCQRSGAGQQAMHPG